MEYVTLDSQYVTWKKYSKVVIIILSLTKQKTMWITNVHSPYTLLLTEGKIQLSKALIWYSSLTTWNNNCKYPETVMQSLETDDKA